MLRGYEEAREKGRNTYAYGKYMNMRKIVEVEATLVGVYVGGGGGGRGAARTMTMGIVAHRRRRRRTHVLWWLLLHRAQCFSCVPLVMLSPLTKACWWKN